MKSITTIVTPPTVTNMVTMERMAIELGLTNGQAKKRVPSLIEDASGLVCNYCNRTFARTTVNQKFPMVSVPYPYTLVMPPVTRIFRLRFIPVASIVSASYNGNAVDPSTISYDPESGQIFGIQTLNSTQFFAGLFDSITYTGGYLMPGQTGRDLPIQIERACIDTVAMLWHRGGKDGRDPMTKLDAVDKIGTTSYYNPSGGNEDQLPPTAVAALSNFRETNI